MRGWKTNFSKMETDFIEEDNSLEAARARCGLSSFQHRNFPTKENLISKVDASPYAIKPNSLEGKIKSILDENGPLHISDIISKLEAANWNSKSTYHKYSIVSSVLRRNYFTFTKVGKATFSTRKTKEELPAKTKTEQRQKNGSKPTSLKDVMLFYLDKNIRKPYQMFNFLSTKLGYRIRYSAVRRNFQNKSYFFKRNGLYFRKQKGEKQNEQCK